MDFIIFPKWATMTKWHDEHRCYANAKQMSMDEVSTDVIMQYVNGIVNRYICPPEISPKFWRACELHALRSIEGAISSGTESRFEFAKEFVVSILGLSITNITLEYMGRVRTKKLSHHQLMCIQTSMALRRDLVDSIRAGICKMDAYHKFKRGIDALTAEDCTESDARYTKRFKRSCLQQSQRLVESEDDNISRIRIRENMFLYLANP